MKIYMPINDEVRNRVAEEVSGEEEFDYICNKNEYKFLRELSEEEFNSLDIRSKEHEIGNVLIYEAGEYGAGETYILDGTGYFKIKFE